MNQPTTAELDMLKARMDAAAATAGHVMTWGRVTVTDPRTHQAIAPAFQGGCQRCLLLSALVRLDLDDVEWIGWSPTRRCVGDR